MPSTRPPPEILIVDDDAGLRSLLTGYLEREGFRAEAVAEGKAMDRILRDIAYQVVNRPDPAVSASTSRST